MHEGSVFTIDSIEDSVARIEAGDGTTFEIPRYWLPSEAREGQVLKLSLSAFEEQSTLRFTIDEAATAETKKRVRNKLDRLRHRGQR